MKPKHSLEALLRENPGAALDVKAANEILGKVAELRALGRYQPRYDLASPFGGRAIMHRSPSRFEAE